MEGDFFRGAGGRIEIHGNGDEPERDGEGGDGPDIVRRHGGNPRGGYGFKLPRGARISRARPSAGQEASYATRVLARQLLLARPQPPSSPIPLERPGTEPWRQPRRSMWLDTEIRVFASGFRCP